MKKVLFLHAYSALNRGDGLLVDLAVDTALKAFGDECEILVLAIDPLSFEGKYPVLQFPPSSRAGGFKLIGALKFVRAIWFGGDPMAPIAATKFGRPDIIVGVGGGYMRTDGAFKSLKALVAHGLQLRWAVGTGIPTFYLPQSVGPLSDWAGRIMLRWCKRLNHIAVRDDRSFALVGGVPSVSRRPDMAIFSIAETLSIPSKATEYSTGVPRLIARQLDRERSVRLAYEAKLRALVQAVPDMEVALQSAGRGNDDPAFYEAMGWTSRTPFLRDLIASKDRPQVVVSVRLHGALEAIRAGIPTIHLSYERKGFGAYADLGIEEFVHNSNDFDLDLVIAQVAQLRADPRAYWDRVRSRQIAIRNEYATLINDMCAAVDQHSSGFHTN